MILQRAEHPSAMDYLESHPEPEAFIKLVCKCFMSRHTALIVFAQVTSLVEGVYYLHTMSPPIVHGDLHDVGSAIADSKLLTYMLKA